MITAGVRPRINEVVEATTTTAKTNVCSRNNKLNSQRNNMWLNRSTLLDLDK